MLACALTAGVAQACGPDFPTRYLDASEERLLASPEAYFAQEVERIASRARVNERSGVSAVREAEDVDLKTAYERGREAAARTERLDGRSDSERRAARDEAVKWFGLTRALVEAGAQDEENLSRESVGWEAFAELQVENFIPAIALYLRHHREGDETAVNSLRFVMRRLFRDGAWQKNGLGEKLANDPQARQVWTAWLLAQGNRWTSWESTEFVREVANAAQIWAGLLDKAGVSEVTDADRFAWVAYQGGNFALAAEWVRLAAKESGAAEWIRGKLALRAGDLAAGELHLRAAITAEDLAPQRAVIAGELGRVLLARDRAAEALAVWLEAGHWEDAAYVAERVMTLTELRAFVDGRVGKRSAAPPAAAGEDSEQNWWRLRWGTLESPLRHLLARRLMRANRGDDALEYFPAETAVVAREYLAEVRAGFDLARKDAERAGAFWRAARLVRRSGMELQGTELEPDWAIWGGSYDTGPAAKMREELAGRTGGTFATTTEELARLAEHAVPEQRFHYRYRAAQLAWWAAALMPNDAEETAAVLNEAGGWLKSRDPKAAKAFYEALVVRCGRTELGKAAAAKRWFSDEAKVVNP